MTDPVDFEMSDADNEDFELWWDNHGQFCRAGGGQYEKTFAYHAWESALAAATNKRALLEAMPTRKHFVGLGLLYPCPNKSHSFKIGRLFGEWCWASDAWSSVTEGLHPNLGYLITYGVSLHTLTTSTNEKVYRLFVWKLSLIMSFKKTPY